MNPSPMPKLSSRGAEIPVIGFGTSQFGNCGEIVANALKVGYRHIDTAWKYGTEKGVGEGIKTSGVPRQGHLPVHQGLARVPARGRLRALGGRKPATPADGLRRPAARALADHRQHPARRNHGRAGEGEARRQGAPHRRRELQHRAHRGSDAALPRAALGAAGRVSPVSRPVEGAGVLPQGRARSSWPTARSAAGRVFKEPVLDEIAQQQGQNARPGRAALAGAAGQHRPDPALLQSQAHGRKPGGLRFRADRRRDEAGRRAQAIRRQDCQSGGTGSGLGLRSALLRQSQPHRYLRGLFVRPHQRQLDRVAGLALFQRRQ